MPSVQLLLMQLLMLLMQLLLMQGLDATLRHGACSQQGFDTTQSTLLMIASNSLTDRLSSGLHNATWQEEERTSNLPKAPMPSFVIQRILAAPAAAVPAPALRPTAANRLEVMREEPIQPVI